MNRVACALGFHAWSTRELHAVEPVTQGAEYLRMAIIERCECGESRIPFGGGAKRTRTGLIVPACYMPTHNAAAVEHERFAAEIARLRARVLELEAVHEDASGVVLTERERWQRIAIAAQDVTTGCEDRIGESVVPSHLMAALALALDEAQALGTNLPARV